MPRSLRIRSASPSAAALDRLLAQVRACERCRAELPLPPRPVVHLAADSRVLIIGQAPGLKVHNTGISWNDASGERLRAWLGVDRDAFYDTQRFAIMAMAFCYPGRAESSKGRGGGDRPPPKACAPLWHERLRAQLPKLRLTLLIGSYAQAYYLGSRAALADTVRDWARYAAQGLFPLPHPSPRNIAWFQRHPWFETEVLPALRSAVDAALADA